jgi:outer membrane receptor protein involved in Fe transport
MNCFLPGCRRRRCSRFGGLVQTHIRTVAVVFLILMSSILPTHAQEQTGRLSGTVIDQSGGAVVGAKVVVRNLATGATRDVESDKSGVFAFDGLPDGTYELTADADGFQHLIREGIVVVGGKQVDAKLELKVANRKENVTVVETSGYVAPEVSTVSKLDLPIAQTPLSVQLIPSGVIQDQLALRLPDITRNVSGVQTNFGYGALYEAFALRGFETNVILRNGERVSGGIGRSSVDVANVENVEVLKGPAAMMYGRLEPGGMINVVTKKPLESHHYSLEQEFGSYDLYRTTLDATDRQGRLASISRNLLVLRCQSIHHLRPAREKLFCRTQSQLETNEQADPECQHRISKHGPLDCERNSGHWQSTGRRSNHTLSGRRRW